MVFESEHREEEQTPRALPVLKKKRTLWSNAPGQKTRALPLTEPPLFGLETNFKAPERRKYPSLISSGERKNRKLKMPKIYEEKEPSWRQRAFYTTDNIREGQTKGRNGKQINWLAVPSKSLSASRRSANVKESLLSVVVRAVFFLRASAGHTGRVRRHMRRASKRQRRGCAS